MPTPMWQMEEMSLWLGTSHSSGHHAGVSTQWACQRTHLLLSSREGLGIVYWSESSSCSSPAQCVSSWNRKSWLGVGGHPKSSALGCDQSVWPPCTICLPRTVARSHQPQWLGCPQMLPIALSVMGLETVLSYWYVPHGMMSQGILCYSDLQP